MQFQFVEKQYMYIQVYQIFSQSHYVSAVFLMLEQHGQC